MIKASYHILTGIMGIVILFLAGLCHHGNAQSIALEKVTVGQRSFPSVEVYFSFEGLPADYDYENDGLVVFILKYTVDPEDNLMKYIPYETLSSTDFDFLTMMEDGIPLSWNDLSGDHDNKPERYALKLEDLAGNPLGIITPGHQTIFLNGIFDEDVDRCNGSITMSWENYKHFQTSGNVADSDVELEPFFTHNRIMYVPPVGGDERVAATLDFSIENYEFDFEDGPGNYTIWVQAVELDGIGNELRTSNSNYRTVPYDSPVLTNLEIIMVNVVENREIDVIFNVEGGESGDLEHFVFEVYRSSSLEGEYALVGEGALSLLSGDFSFTDTNVPDLLSGPYYYYVSGRLDECEVEDEASAVMSSLFLEGAIDTHTETQLTVWLEGTHFPVGMDYQLTRKFPGEPGEHEWISVGSFVPYQMYPDDLTSYISELAGEIRYRVEGTTGTGGIFYSNEVIIPINVGLEIYNAFRPSSGIEANRAFRPRLMGVSPSYFRLRVFDQWGQELYSYISTSGSLEDFEGWDGNGRDGRDVAPGVYGFRLEYQIGNNERVEKTGVVTLVR